MPNYVPDPNGDQNDQWLFELLNRLRGECAKWVLEGLKIESGVDVEFNYDGEFNAYATIEGGVDVVRINLGVIYILRDLFNRMLSHPQILRDIGNPSIETNVANYPANRKTIDLSTAMREVDVTQLPKDPTRRNLANWLFFVSVEFIFFHELFHIIHGHVDYLKSLGGLRAISESGLELHRLNDLDRHTIEMDADRMAADAMLSRIFGPLLYTQVQFQSLDDPLILPRSQRLLGFCFALYTCFRIFADDSLAHSEDQILRLRHPPAQLRQLSAILDATYLVRNSGYLPEITIEQVQGKAVIECELAFTRLLNDPNARSADILLTVSKQLNMRTKFREHWSLLRPKLDLLKRGGELPPLFES